MVTKLRAAGAYDVISHGAAWRDADTYLREHVMPQVRTSSPRHPPIHPTNPRTQARTETIYCPPFDHPDIWTGNSTVLHEIAAQMPDAPPDVIICSVGGGGLLNGIMQGLAAYPTMPPPTILAVETAGADSLAASLHAGSLVSLPRITSQATSLGCARVTPATYAYAQRAHVRSVVLPDAEAAMGCWRLADDERMMVELACGVNVALCYGGRLERALGRPVRREEKVVVVLCGGSNVSSGMLCDWRREYAHVDAEEERRDSAYVSENTSPEPEAVGKGDGKVPSELTMPVIEGIEVAA
jgi:L-serine/L-threonine ammonia-lyase